MSLLRRQRNGCVVVSIARVDTMHLGIRVTSGVHEVREAQQQKKTLNSKSADSAARLVPQPRAMVSALPRASFWLAVGCGSGQRPHRTPCRDSDRSKACLCLLELVTLCFPSGGLRGVGMQNVSIRIRIHTPTTPPADLSRVEYNVVQNRRAFCSFFLDDGGTEYWKSAGEPYKRTPRAWQNGLGLSQAEE